MSEQSIAKDKKLIELKEYIFNIPHYQRLFDWRETEVKTLLDDLYNAYKEKKRNLYYLGNIVLNKIDKNKHYYDVIDGQQRLTVLWLLGICFYKLGCKSWKDFLVYDDPEKPRVSAALRKSENEALLAIFNDKDKDIKVLISKHLPESPNINSKFILALSVMAEFIKGIKNITEFSAFILDKVTLVLVELNEAEKGSINKYFVRMNNRGKQLEQHEILKARILKKIKDDGDKECSYYAKIWDICSQMNVMIYKNKFKVANDSEINNKSDTICDIINVSQGKPEEEKDEKENFESFVTFPRFLLYVLKLFVDTSEKVNINDKELIMTFAGKDKKQIKIFEDKETCKKFIDTLLVYRVIFDLFIIKSRVNVVHEEDNGQQYIIYDANKLIENTGYSPILKGFAFTQNFLRVARPQDVNQGYQWLAPLLKYLFNKLYSNEQHITDIRKGLENITNEEEKPDTHCFNQVQDINICETEIVSWLETLDDNMPIGAYINEYMNEVLKLADITQCANLTIENDYIKANQVKTLLKNTRENLAVEDNKINEYQVRTKLEYPNSSLNKGTDTHRYWFRKLDYILYKEYNKYKKKQEMLCDCLKDVFNEKISEDEKKALKRFYFSDSINSVEHVQPQSKATEGGWKVDDTGKREIDMFGNLALISTSSNSSSSANPVGYKHFQFVEQKNLESIKLLVMYKKHDFDGSNWTPKEAELHENEMIDILQEYYKKEA